MSFIDERIVKMVFDNNEFAQKVSGTINSLTQLNKATEDVGKNSGKGVSELSNAFGKAEITATQAGFHIRDVWLKVASILEYQVAGKIVDMGKKIANAMTIEGITDGFREYELKMGSVQTIMAGTGESLQTVNKYLEELNKYSDQTIYSFADMTNNIGKFTNAGVKLEDAVAAIKGIANEAAISGANANEASRAMYNFSQALSAGYVKLIDWKSIENANMATLGFKDTLLEVASTVGTVEKQADGMYQVLTTNAQGKKMDELVSGTKNFNDSLQQQWMTTEVLTKALKIYATDVRSLSEEEKRAYEEELRTMGMNEEQIKHFEELGSKATDAASEIKTFTMLIDTLKEAIGSGWAMTWELLIGDFEEAKALWTEVGSVLGGLVDKSSDARNELIKGWKALGGRKDVIDGLRNSFEFFVKVLKPIGEAMREIFPPTTRSQLYMISHGFKEFTESLKVTSVTATNIRNIARGVFSVLDIGLKLVKAFVGAILPMGKGVGSLGGSLLEVAGNLGKFIYEIDKAITESKVFEKTFTGIANVIKPIFSFILSGAKGVTTLLSNFFKGFSEGVGNAKSSGDILKGIFDDVAGGVENIKKKFESLRPIFDGLTSIFKGLGKAVGTLLKQIGDSISGFSAGGNGIGGIMNIFNALISGGIMYQLYSGVTQFKKFGEGFSGVLDGLGNALNSFGEKVGSEVLLNTAKAVGILAVSLLLVASIDSNKLTSATLAISTMVGVLTGSMALLMKAVEAFSKTNVTKSFSIFGKQLFGSDATKMLEMAVTLGAVSKALVSMGVAVLAMAAALKIVASVAEGGHLWDSFAVVSLMLAELTAVAIILGRYGQKSKKAAKDLIKMTEALLLMSVALKIVASTVEQGNAWEALGIISIMLAELTGVALLIQNFGKFKLTGTSSIISLAISLNLCVIALKSVSDALGNEGNHIWEALGVISLMLVELAGITILMSKFAGFAALGGAGAILAATSLLILVQALKQINDALSGANNNVWQALGVIAASLLVLAVGVSAMAGTIPGAAGLLVASAALVVLSGALKMMGGMKLSEIGKGLLAMAGSLVILAAGLTAMLVALPGAAALVVAAAGLTILAGALKIFASMSIGEVAKSLLTLVISLTAIAVACTALSVTTPFVLAFSAAILVFSAAVLGVGVGLTLFSAGLQALVAVIPMGVMAIKLLGEALLGLIPILVEKLMDGLGMLAAKVVQWGPAFAEAAVTVIECILKVLVEKAVLFAKYIAEFITKMLQTIADQTPRMAEAGTNMIIAFISAIAKQVPRLVDQAYKCAIAFVNGLAEAIRSNNSSLIAAIDNLMEAVIQAITQWLLKFTPLGLIVPENLKTGILNGEISVKGGIDKILNTIKTTIEGFKDKIKQAGVFVIEGLIEGLKSAPVIGRVVKAAADLGSAAIKGLNSKQGLDEHSPSKPGIESGEYLGYGVIEGEENVQNEVFNASAKLGGGAINALNTPLENGVEETKGIFGSLTDMIKGETVPSVDSLTEATDKGTISEKDYRSSFETSKAALYDRAKITQLNTKITKDNTAETLRSEKMLRKHTDATKINVQAMKTSRDKALALHEVKEHGHSVESNFTKSVKENTEVTNENTQAQIKNAEATGKSGKAAKTSADVMDYASGVVEAFTAKYGHLYKELGEDAPMKVAQFAVKNLAEETYKASLAAEKATDKNKETKASIEDMIKAFTDMKQKLYDSIKSEFEGESFFMDKFEVKTETTMAKVLENMKSHIDGVTSWSAKMQELGEKGVNQGLLKYLMELGPKGYELVNAFANATTEEIAQANTMFEQAAALPDQISNNTLASYAKAGLNCVAGFAGGIDKNVATAAISADNLGKSTLKSLESTLEIHSPSRATYRDGEYLVQGLINGVKAYTTFAVNTCIMLCNQIKTTISNNLAVYKFTGYGQAVANGIGNGITYNTYVPVNAAANMCSSIRATISVELTASKFEEFGRNVAQGLADGLGSSKMIEKVKSAARRLSEIAASVTQKYNDIHSPSKLYKTFGNYIAEGLALGMVHGRTYVEESATLLAEAVENSMSLLEDIAESDMEIHPVISPVLDLNGVRTTAGMIGSLLPKQSLAMASSIGIGSGYESSGNSAEPIVASGASINFTQNNYSPKALNRYEIYRNTNNQIRQLKGVLV